MSEYGWSDFCVTHNVSRETLDRLEAYRLLLAKWQRQINLVGNSTLDTFWSRHILDSAQIWALERGPKKWMDVGSGAGFPGLIVAALSGNQDGFHMHLVESSGKRCAFLREAARALGVSQVVKIDQRKAEEVLADPSQERPDIFTARAFASLSQLLTYAGDFARLGTRLILPKGADVENEINVAREALSALFDMISIEKHQSLSDSQAHILDIRVMDVRA